MSRHLPVSRKQNKNRHSALLKLEQLEDRLVQSIVPLSSPIDAAVGYQAGQVVNSYHGSDADSNGASHHSAAADANGNYRVVYQKTDGVVGLYLRPFNATGAPLGNPVQIPGTGADDYQATIAMNDSGQGVVAWTRKSGIASQVFVQRFDANGMFVGSPQTYLGSGHYYFVLTTSEPSVAIDAAGDYAVAYTDSIGGSPHVRGCFVTASGAQTYFAINDSGHSTNQPSLAMNASGNFVVGYSYGYSATDLDLYVQRFSRGGTAVGNTVVVAGSSHHEFQPSAGMDDLGNFAVAYTYEREFVTVPVFNSSSWARETEVWVDRFDSQGNRLGHAVVASSSSRTANSYDPSLAMSGTGAFIVGFTLGGNLGPANPLINGYPTVKAVAYTSAGGLMEVGIALSSTTTPTSAHRDSMPSVAMSRAGYTVAVWQNYGTKDTAGISGNGVFTQTFVESPFRYEIASNRITIQGGMAATYRVNILRDSGFTGPVDVAFSALPSGVSYTVASSYSAPMPGVASYETRTFTFNSPNNMPFGSLDARLRLSTPGRPTLTPAISFVTRPSNITGVYGPSYPDYSKFFKGLPVTIYGQGFVPGSVVQFGQPGVNNPTLQSKPTINSTGDGMSVVVPAWAADGPISILRPGGAAIVSAASYTYAAPAITSLGQTYGWAHRDLVQGDIVRINGSGFLPGVQVGFGNTKTATPRALDPKGNWLDVEVPRFAVDGKVSILFSDTTVTSAQDFDVRDYRSVYGFSFPNSGVFKFNVSMPMIMETFGIEQTMQTIWTPFGPIYTGAPNFEAWSALSAAVFGINGNGSCLGMVVTALDLQRNPGLVNIGQPAPGTTNDLTNNGDLTYYIQHRHLAQLSQEMINSSLTWARTPHSANDIRTIATNMIRTGDYPIISIHNNNTVTGGHVVAGYDVQNNPDGSFDIYVCDPNRPFTHAEDKNMENHVTAVFGSRIHVTSSGWSFQSAGSGIWSGDFQTGMLMFSYGQVPLKPTIPKLIDSLTTIYFGAAGEETASRPAMIDAVFANDGPFDAAMPAPVATRKPTLSSADHAALDRAHGQDDLTGIEDFDLVNAGKATKRLQYADFASGKLSDRSGR